jgi:hypothetical protein
MENFDFFHTGFVQYILNAPEEFNVNTGKTGPRPETTFPSVPSRRTSGI